MDRWSTLSLPPSLLDAGILARHSASRAVKKRSALRAAGQVLGRDRTESVTAKPAARTAEALVAASSAPTPVTRGSIRGSVSVTTEEGSPPTAAPDPSA
jgi:hypothetical protein